MGSIGPTRQKRIYLGFTPVGLGLGHQTMDMT
jgi:hypothetical protein